MSHFLSTINSKKRHKKPNNRIHTDPKQISTLDGGVLRTKKAVLAINEPLVVDSIGDPGY